MVSRGFGGIITLLCNDWSVHAHAHLLKTSRMYNYYTAGGFYTQERGGNDGEKMMKKYIIDDCLMAFA